MYYPGWPMAGSSHGIDFLPDTLGQVWAWTDSGLYLGPVYNDNNGHALYDSNSLFVELTGAYVYDIGDTTYILAGDHGILVHRLELPKLTPVDGGAVTLTAALAPHARPWDPDGPPPGKRPTYIAPSIFDYDKAVLRNTRTIAIDGRLDPAEWGGVPKMDLVFNGQKVGTVQVTFDHTHLYLAYNVIDPNGLKNDGHELPYAPFVSGSYVDFSLGRDWSTPDRPDSAEGDVRVIMARIGGSPPFNYQMGFWPVRQDLKPFRRPPPGKLNPQDIVSPAQTRHFDDISPLPGLTFAYQITATGYTLEAAVPLASLGLDPARQPVVGFDASVGFADALGTSRQSAAHWAGETEAAVVDRPGSAELRPATWGSLEFDRTPLPAAVAAQGP
ncbi:MAG: sugar-binding protein [Verrucomicrobiota bacterium]